MEAALRLPVRKAPAPGDRSVGAGEAVRGDREGAFPIERLRRELVETKKQLEFEKKAAAFFAQKNK